MTGPDLSQASMMELFRADATSQLQALTAGLLALERNPASAESLEACMRAAHSIKGAARIVGIVSGARVAHAMEDCFVEMRKGHCVFDQSRIDCLLRGIDLLSRIAQTPEQDIAVWTTSANDEVDALIAAFSAEASGPDAIPAPALEARAQRIAQPQAQPLALPIASPAPPPASGLLPSESGPRTLRVTADNLNRLLGLAGESLVESRRLQPFTESLLRLKRMHYELHHTLDRLRETVSAEGLAEAQRRSLECQHFVSQRLQELESFERRIGSLSHGLYESALACRMRPFSDGTATLPRLVRDVARALGRQARLEISGNGTQVDRDILEKLDAPLGHLLRNAIDHGIEPPQERIAAGKSAEGVVRIEARHSAGRLQITISDDGRGIDPEEVRRAVLERQLAPAEIASRLGDAELFEFLLLPGFSMAQHVTEISGRGVGLDAVQDMVRQVRGSVRILSERGTGTRIQLLLPLTLSVVRTLLVEVDSEPYAIPLAAITRTLKIERSSIEQLEGRENFVLDGRQRVGLISARQILNGSQAGIAGDELCVIVLGEHGQSHGFVVDRFLGERELVVQPLDPRLGKVTDIAAGALMEDGAPVLILDVADLMRSVEKLCSTERLSRMDGGTQSGEKARARRVLVVDDSLTVRELERKLLVNAGYDVEVAVDGMEAWNIVRTKAFDLLITDIDMPRVDGIELIELVKRDPHLRSLPAMIVSYKDRPEDRRRGLEAGADYYLAKGSFQDDALLEAVADLIGRPEAA